MISTLKMPVAEWYKVEDNPIQRDTERHAAKAKHLMVLRPSHAFVFAAQLPSGKLIKLDGHTRSLIWSRGDVVPPSHVIVNLIPVKDRAEAEELYQTFDTPNALETARDRVSGGLNKFGLTPQSQLLKAGSIGVALKMSYAVLAGLGAVSGTTGHVYQKGLMNGVTIYHMIRDFQNELIALDAFMPSTQNTSSGLVAAFLITFRRYGRAVTPFWQKYFDKEGVKSGGKMDGVQAVTELMLQRNKFRSGGGSAAAELCARIVRGVEGWMNDEKFTRVPSPMSLEGYLSGKKRPNERLLKKADIDRERQASHTA